MRSNSKNPFAYLNVIFEDNHILAVNKPSGRLVQGDETGDAPLSDDVKAYIKSRYDKPGDVFLGTVHRLDRPVSGALMYARTSKALERLNKLFADRKIEKTYWALVKERPEPLSGTLVDYLAKDHERNITKALDGPSRRYPDAKRAELSYELIASIGNFHMLEIKPTTGRPHQIRAQLARFGCPIRGDVKYGFPQGNADGSIQLHCRSMVFEHPTLKTPVEIVADLPETQIWREFARLFS